MISRCCTRSSSTRIRRTPSIRRLLSELISGHCTISIRVGLLDYVDGLDPSRFLVSGADRLDGENLITIRVAFRAILAEQLHGALRLRRRFGPRHPAAVL